MQNKETPDASALASTLSPLAPLLPLGEATEFLRDFFKLEPPYTPGDDLGTCYSSWAAVMLTMMVVGSENCVILAGVTSYPAPFTAAVCSSMRRHGLWHVRSVLYLRAFLEMTPRDWKALPEVLNEAMMTVWNVVETLESRLALESLRRNVLFGGETQRWLDEDSAEYFDLL